MIHFELYFFYKKIKIFLLKLFFYCIKINIFYITHFMILNFIIKKKLMYILLKF